MIPNLGSRRFPVHLGSYEEGTEHSARAFGNPKARRPISSALQRHGSRAVRRCAQRVHDLFGCGSAASAGWPKSCHRLGNELRRVAPQLRMFGLSVNFDRTGKGRFITVTSEAVPIIQLTGANPDPVSSSADENSADTPVDTRNSNDGNMIQQ
jgi:hypothetical protein